MNEHDIRRRFRLALLGYVILALAATAGIAYNHHQQTTLDAHQRAIVVELRGVKANQDAIVRLTVNTAAAICLEAFAAGDPAEATRLVEVFNHEGAISVGGNRTCERAVQRAKVLIVP